MSGTKRALNRMLLLAIGLVLAAAGVTTILTGTNQRIAESWTASGTTVWSAIQERLEAARIPGGDTSWWSIAVLALLGILAVLLISWMASQGTARVNELAQQNDAAGNTVVDTAVAAQIIKESLAANTAVLATKVQSWKCKGSPEGAGLRISIQTRKGVSPIEVSAAVEHTLAGLDQLLGGHLPVLIRVKAGTRTKFSHTKRVA